MVEWFDPKNINTPFGVNYHEEFKVSDERTTQEISSIERIIHKNFLIKPHTLDLAGGFGRIGKHLLDRKLVTNLVDFDLNQDFLIIAKQSGVNRVINGDIRDLPFQPETFDLTLLMFTSFGYFADSNDDIKVLKNVYRVLKKNGQFVLDIPNFDRIVENFIPTRELQLRNSEVIRYAKRIEDDGTLTEERTIIDAHGNNKPLAAMKIRIYLSQNILSLCNEVGFSKVELMDENLNNFDPHLSRRLWVKCTKYITN